MVFLNINLYHPITKSTADEFIQSIDSVINILQNEQHLGNITGGKINFGFIELDVPENLVIIGDLHGDLKSLLAILADVNYENFLKIHNNKMIFMGDYIDRGSHSIDVLHTILRLKQKYPHSVILMRGNHEATSEFPFSSHDLPDKIQQQFGRNLARIIYERLLTLFQSFPLLVLVRNHLILVHGGLPTAIERDFGKLITRIEHGVDKKILEELLWNDPRDNISNDCGWENSRRGTGRHFGKGITKKWLETSGTKVVVRGHEPCHGFKIDHDGSIMTLFSCKESYPDFDAAYLFITNNQLDSILNAHDLSHYVRKL